MTVARSVPPPTTNRALTVIREQIDEGIAAKKCHGCGCFQQTVTALSATEPGTKELAQALSTAKETFTPKKYDCLGCAVCFPAIAANAFTEAFPDAGEIMDLCPTEEPVERAGWPPLPGDFEVVRYGAPVAVCTLNSNELMTAMSSAAPEGLAIVGTMHTENLGIERLIQNIMANPNIRFLVLCGEDTQQAVGHLPGQSLASLTENGIDEAGRIVGAGGKRPVVKNVTREMVQAFRDQVELVSLLGETDIARISAVVDECARRTPGPHVAEASRVTVQRVQARAPDRLIPDPAGYFVVYPEKRTKTISVEHFTNAGVLDVVIDGETPAAVYGTIIARGIITRLDHAAYLGRELARAARSIEAGEPYVQDRAPGEIEEPQPSAASCGCPSSCGPRGAQ